VTHSSYAVVTPARDEARNLNRLADALAAQTVRPSIWIIVDDGSTDGSSDVIRELRSSYSFVHSIRLGSDRAVARGGPVVRAFHEGLRLVEPRPEVVVKLDADVSFGDRYFERLLAAFEADDRLGIASGTCYEQDAWGSWRQRFGTGESVWGAARAYRRECLDDVLPLDENIGWDGIDALKANARGWRTRTIGDLPFFHHRVEGERDGDRRRQWASRGRSAHYMGYRPTYLVARSLYKAVRDPAALGLIAGYLAASAQRSARCSDPEVRYTLRREQRLRNLARRAREASGRNA
jgi:glycosyltransferase involved in cell wall biosynthesis